MRDVVVLKRSEDDNSVLPISKKLCVDPASYSPSKLCVENDKVPPSYSPSKLCVENNKVTASCSPSKQKIADIRYVIQI